MTRKSTFKNTKRRLFPVALGSGGSASLLRSGLQEMRQSCKTLDAAWVSMRTSGAANTADEHDIFSSLPEEGIDPTTVVSTAVRKFFDGIPNWRSPELQYNVCAPANIAAVALMSLAQEFNVHNINSDFSGHCLVAESLVAGMMADLVGIQRQQVKALFSFGGTASNLYAMKMAIHKALPGAGKTGLSGNIFVMITSSAHFSHRTAADWLGIGTDRLIEIDADDERRSMLDNAERKADSILAAGGLLACIMLNGGTLYDAVIDDIAGFVNLRNKLVQKHNLAYVPHIHVDSVIGWVWLMFAGYDFVANPLRIPAADIDAIRVQFERAYQIREADSWGVDFHKALGGCPAPCGLFVVNNGKELLLLSKSLRGVGDTHQLGGDWSMDDPSDVTLETSRSAGPPLAALGSLLTLGKNGFRSFVANQVRAARMLRKLIPIETSFIVGNPMSLGFNVMLVIAPESIRGTRGQEWSSFLAAVESDSALLDSVNKELRDFYGWCRRRGGTLGCSFSRSFVKTRSGMNVSGLKYYVVSPHTSARTIAVEVQRLERLFETFRNDERNG